MKSSSPPVVSENLSMVTDVGPRHDVSDIGELSPNCVSAAEVLSRFRNSGPMRFLESEETETVEEIGMRRLKHSLHSLAFPK